MKAPSHFGVHFHKKAGPKKTSQKTPILGTPFFVKMGSKMGGGLPMCSFVPAPSQTLPLLPTWRGKANRKVPRICPFTFHVAEQLRNPRVLFFNFEIDSISETLTNAKTRHDFFLALGFFAVNVEYRSVITPT